MTTLADMTEQVISDLSSYVRTQDSLTVLTASMTDSDTSMTVDDISGLSKGLVEIGDELVYVKRLVPADSMAQILPGTRGFKNTTAVAHTENTLVRNSPTFPRSAVQRAINDTLLAVDLSALGKYDFEFDGTSLTYPLPVGCTDVVGVTAESQDSTNRWPEITHFRLDPNYWGTGDTEARMAIELRETPASGSTVRVQYLGTPTALALPATLFSTTGLPASCVDMIRLGAMWRLIATLDPGKLVATAPSADAQDAAVPVGKGSDVSRYLFQLFSARLAEEKAKQVDLFAKTIHYQG